MNDLASLSASDVSRIIQLIVAPAVMISACAILAGSLVGRSSAINDRLRSLTRERFDLLHTPPTGSRSRHDELLNQERLNQIANQLPDLLRRLKITHSAVTTVYTALLFFILDSLLIALAAISNTGLAAYLAVGCFLLGLLALALAIVTTIRELWMSLNSINFEVASISQLKPAHEPEGHPRD